MVILCSTKTCPDRDVIDLRQFSRTRHGKAAEAHGMQRWHHSSGDANVRCGVEEEPTLSHHGEDGGIREDPTLMLEARAAIRRKTDSIRLNPVIEPMYETATHCHCSCPKRPTLTHVRASEWLQQNVIRLIMS